MENNFGQFLKQKRIEKNMTQKELAKALFVSESAVSKWEKNVARPDITLLPTLSQILGVTEHELITASIDRQSRQQKAEAKKWRAFSKAWSLFFYISYSVAILTCFICNLAVDKTLSWFWIVLSALLLAFTFTCLPKFIKKHKLILLPLSMFLALCLLLGVCCIYTKGNWFFIASLPVLLALVIVFVPIYICKYKVFSKIKRYNDFICVAIDFVMLNILLVVINLYTVVNDTVNQWWYVSIALPIVIGVYLFLNLLLSVRFIKTNRFFKTSIILSLINLVLYLPPLFVKAKNPSLQTVIDDANVFKADFSIWQPNITLQNNINGIIALTLLSLAVIFVVMGVIRAKRKKSKQ